MQRTRHVTSPLLRGPGPGREHLLVESILALWPSGSPPSSCQLAARQDRVERRPPSQTCCPCPHHHQAAATRRAPAPAGRQIRRRQPARRRRVRVRRQRLVGGWQGRPGTGRGGPRRRLGPAHDRGRRAGQAPCTTRWPAEGGQALRASVWSWPDGPGSRSRSTCSSCGAAAVSRWDTIGAVVTAASGSASTSPTTPTGRAATLAVELLAPTWPAGPTCWRRPGGPRQSSSRGRSTDRPPAGNPHTERMTSMRCAGSWRSSA